MAPMAETTAFSNRPFLRAEWRHLALLNFEVDPRVLGKFVPAGTELDLWNGHTYVIIIQAHVLGNTGHAVIFK